MSNLTISMQHYIKAVYELSLGGNDFVRIVDIADELGVSKASASFAMTRLEVKGLVYKNTQRQAMLTPEGENLAVLMLDKAAIIRRFLCNELGLDPAIANADACAMEHVISADTLCALCRFSGSAHKRRKCVEDCRVKEQGSLELES